MRLNKLESSISVVLLVLMTAAIVQIYLSTSDLSAQVELQQANAIYTDSLLLAQHPHDTLLTTSTEVENTNITVPSLAMATIGNNNLVNVSARAYIVANIKTGEVYTQKNIDDIRPIASITKLLTAITAEAVIEPNSMIPMQATYPIITSDYRQLHKGVRIKFTDTLFPLLMESNNAVAHSLANYYNNDMFISEMLRKAKSIGMDNTDIDDASGISASNTSTVRDLFKLSRYLFNTSTNILKVTKLQSTTIDSSIQPYTITNHNHFSKNPNFIGGKTGYTNAARQTMLTIFNIDTYSEDKEAVAIIILGSEQRKEDILTLYIWLNQLNKTRHIQKELLAADEVTYISGHVYPSLLPES